MTLKKFTAIVSVLLAALMLLSSCGGRPISFSVGEYVTPPAVSASLDSPYDTDELPPYTTGLSELVEGRELTYFTFTSDTGVKRWFRIKKDGSPPEATDVSALADFYTEDGIILEGLRYQQGCFINRNGQWLRESDGQIGRFSDEVFVGGNTDVVWDNYSYSFSYSHTAGQDLTEHPPVVRIHKRHVNNIYTNAQKTLRRGDEHIPNPDYIPDAFEKEITHDIEPDEHLEVIRADKDWVYYIASRVNVYPSPKKLYRISQTGEGGETFVAYGTVFVFDGDYVYYADPVQSALFRVKTDGTEDTQLAESVSTSYFYKNEIVAVSGDYVYYTTNGTEGRFLVRTMADGSGQPEIIVPVRVGFVYSGGAFYFYARLREDARVTLCRLEESAITAGNTEQNLQKAVPLSDPAEGLVMLSEFLVLGDWIVYSNGDIYRMRTDGTEKEILAAE